MPSITIINHSDCRGGAAVVMYRLMRALTRLGVDARMLVSHKGTDDMRVDVLEPAWRRRAAFLAECAEIYTANGFNKKDIFKVSTASWGMDVLNHPWVKNADGIILGWINQGTLSLDEIRRLPTPRRRVAWAMHDMWNATGVCHHAGECANYLTRCGRCPQLHSSRTSDLSTRVFNRKAGLYGNTHIKFVAVSNWLADCCRRSALMSGVDIRVIPNAFPADEFQYTPTRSRQSLHLPEGQLIVMGAARLDDPIKNLPLAVETLNLYHAQHPGTGVHAVFYGDLRDPRALDGLTLPHTHLGVIPVRDVADVYAHADVVLSTSHYETLPGTLIEGMACGATPVATANGGQADIVTHGQNGYLAYSPTPETLAKHVAAALSAPFPRRDQHLHIARRFSADNIARQYLALLLRE